MKYEHDKKKQCLQVCVLPLDTYMWYQESDIAGCLIEQKWKFPRNQSQFPGKTGDH